MCASDLQLSFQLQLQLKTGLVRSLLLVIKLEKCYTINNICRFGRCKPVLSDDDGWQRKWFMV